MWLRQALHKSSVAFLLLTLLVSSVPVPVQAERLWTSGVEWQSILTGVEASGLGTFTMPAISTSVVHSGAASGHIASIADATIEGYSQTFSPTETTLYARAYVYIDDLIQNADAHTGFHIAFWDQFSNEVADVFIENTGGTLDLSACVDSTTCIADNAVLSFDTWYRIEMYVNTADADGSDDFSVSVDGLQVANSNTLTIVNAPVTSLGVFVHNNGIGSTDSTSIVYVDDMAVNNTVGIYQTSAPGPGSVAMLFPNGTGDNNCTTGDYSMINEVPPSDVAVSGSTICELDTLGDVGDFNVTDSFPGGINSFDTITFVQPMIRIREQITTGAPSEYNMRVKSASGGTASTTPYLDASNTTVRTNPSTNNAFANRFVLYTDPTTTGVWSATGVNSLDNMQIGVQSNDSDPDIFITTYAVLVEYVDGNPPPRPMRLSGGVRLQGVRLR